MTGIAGESTRQFYTLAEAGAILDLSYLHAWRAGRRGVLTMTRDLSGHLVVTAESVRRFAEEKLRARTAQPTIGAAVAP